MKKFKFLLILLLAFAVTFTLFACTDKTDDTDDTGSGIDNGTNEKTLWDREEVNERIDLGFRNAGNGIAEQKTGVRNVVSRYDLLVDIINMTFYYEANYNLSRPQDSEILFRVFNNQYQQNELFIYYNEGNLYYMLDDDLRKIENFGNTSSFDSFYKAMSVFDAGSYYFSEDFSVFLTAGIPTTRNISIIPIGSEKESILFTDVNLNVAVVPYVNEQGVTETISIREYINGMIKKYSSLIGESFDALSQLLVGFKLSIFKTVEIGVINLDKLNIVNKNKTTESIQINISGKQADNIGVFRFDFFYTNTGGAGNIDLTRSEDPDVMVEDIEYSGNYKYLNDYKKIHLGQMHLAGEMYIPSLDIDEDHPFYVEIKGSISSSGNENNLLYIDIRDKTSDNLQGSGYYINKSIGLICYENGVTYVDMEGLRDLYLGDGIALWQLLDVPGGAAASDKLRFRMEGLDLSRQYSLVTDFLMSLIMTSDAENTILSLLSYERLETMLSYIGTEGSKIVVTLNDQLVADLIGEDSADLIEWMAEELGISDTIIKSVLGTGVLEDVCLKLSYDTVTKEIGITMYNGTEIIFILSLFSQDIPDDGINIDFPAEYYTGEYYSIQEPQAVTLELSGQVTKQGASPVDMSAFMGAFIGDVTGANTPYSISINDILRLDMSLTSVGARTYVKAILKAGTKNTAAQDYAVIMELYTVVTGTDASGIRQGTVYCDNRLLGIKYSMTLQGLMDAFTELLGEENIFTVDGVMNVVNMLSEGGSVAFNDDDIAIRLAPYEKNGISHDPIYELIGLRSLIADLNAKVRFVNGASFETLQDVFGASFSEESYPVPRIAQLPSVRFRSIYEATWHDRVDVAFGGQTVSFKLSFLGDSAKLKSNTYDYYPEAKLFGEIVTYMMVLTDVTNGTKVISELGISKLSINPIEEQPIPTEIPVLYDDGTRGSLPFVIVNFPYSATTISAALQGLALKNYTIIIGKGSIAERRFTLPIEILSRTIIPLVLTSPDGNSTYSYTDNVPIVATRTIDPYDYMIRKNADPAYNPVDPAGEFLLYFQPINTQTGITSVNILQDPAYAAFSWNFDESVINFRGGRYYVVADYYTLKIALEVTVKARIFDYVKVFVKDPDHGLLEEANGQYTIDALLPNSYAMPVTTDSRAEVRVYFKTGNYRVIGQNLGIEANNVCDGEFPVALTWSFVADNIDIDGSSNPLNGGTTNVNKGYFAFESSRDKRFQQNITLIVNCPSRRLQLLADAVRCEIDRSGDNTSVMGDVKLNKIAFAFTLTPSDKETDYGRYEYNPIALASYSRLPSYVYILVRYGNQDILRRYPVVWAQSSLIDGNGNLRYPSADEVYVKATGTIGTQTATIAIHNIRAPYVLDILDPNNGDVVLTEQENDAYVLRINPYDNYVLPQTLSVRYTVRDVDQTFHNLIWYRSENGVLIEIASSYKFGYQGGDKEIYTYIQKDPSAGILAQTIRLIVRVEPMTLNNNNDFNYSANALDAGFGCLADQTGLRYVSVDTYSPGSLALLELLEGGISELTLSFLNGSGDIVNKSGLLVTWEDNSIENVIAALKSPLGSSLLPNGNITLQGRIFRGTNIEQSVSFTYKIGAQTFNQIDFTNLQAYPYFTKTAAEIHDTAILADQSKYDVLTIDVNPDTKEISVFIKKPYALKGADNGYALPSGFFAYLFGNITLIITGPTGTRQIPGASAIYEIEENFDDQALNFAGPSSVTSVNFVVSKLNAGSSCEERFNVLVLTKYDAPVQNTLTTNIETLTENGRANSDYSTGGYAVMQNVRVTYLYSGTINYVVDKWSISDIYQAYKYNEQGERVKDDENSLLGLDDETIRIIPNALFNTLYGRTIRLHTTLPDGTVIYNELKFLPKNIRETDYQGIAADPNYSIGVMGIQGAIVLRNVYAVFPFDVSKLPTTITPNQSSVFNTVEGNSVSFTVAKWTPAPEFATAEGNFDSNKLFELINSGGQSLILLATADINSGYPVTICDENGTLTEVQKIKLYITVAQLYQYSLSHARLPITIRSSEKVVLDPMDDSKNFFKTTSYAMDIDPYGLNGLDVYQEGGRYYFRLPDTLTATMYSRLAGGTAVTTVNHTFHTGDLRYEIADSAGVFHSFGEVNPGLPFAAIPYSYNGHTLGSDFPGATDTLTVRAYLKDYRSDGYGQYFEFKITFLDRTLAATSPVKVQNNATLPGADGMLIGKYYIDPYDPDAYTLPETARFYFEGGSSKELPIVWTVPVGAPFASIGGSFRYTPSETFYEGGTYIFRLVLTGVNPQTYYITVIVLNRSLVQAYNKTYYFENTLWGLASDIPNTLSASDFVPLSDSLYDDYNAIAEPVIPYIAWNVTDKEIDFLNGFSNKLVMGSLTNGTISGESARVTISGYKLQYVRMEASIDEFGNRTAITGNIIEFNSYTNSSADAAFAVIMQRYAASGEPVGGSFEVIFYSKPYTSTDMQKRAVIDWGNITDYSETSIRDFYLCNLHKMSGAPDNRIKVTGFKYSFGQMIINEIDLGYGRNTTNLVEFVIDPIYPQIPATVTAYGTNTITHREVTLENVAVVWDQEVYQHTSLSGGQYLIGLGLIINGAEVARFQVIVYYLNRVAKNIYTTDPNFSTMGIVEGYYRLLITNPVTGIRTSYFELDPIKEAIYDAQNLRYKLPTNLKVTYNYDFAPGTALYKGIEKLGAETYYDNLTYEKWLISGNIELFGTPQDAPLILKMKEYTFRYIISGTVSTPVTKEISAANNRLDESYDLLMTVLNRSVVYTNISSQYTNEEGAVYQMASSQYAIDPYNPEFPDSISVYFLGRETDPKHYSAGTFTWQYDETYLEDEDVISGNDPAKLFMWASIKVFGATLNIKFAIKSRYIDVPRYPNGGVIGIDGGTYYVLKNANIATALPTYLYYKFESDSATEVARVPLSFPSSELAKIDTSKVGVTFSIKGKLGKIDDNNINVNVTIIDPVIYNVFSYATQGGGMSYSNGSFIYDRISVPRDQLGNYNAGQEYQLMPRIVIVESNGNYLEIDNTRTVYDIAAGKVTFYCKYLFRSSSDKLSGNANGYDEDSAKLSLVFTRDIVSYNYNNISEELGFRNAQGDPVSNYIFEVPLGQVVYSSQMPLAYASTGEGIPLFWNFSGVNVNKAGDYTAVGYYRNQLETNVPLTLTVRVKKQQLVSSDVIIDNYWLERRYSGAVLPLNGYLSIVDFLRENGDYAQVNYTIAYAFNASGPWITSQPVDVGTYYVRIMINDYNIEGYKIYSFTIRVNEIAENELFYKDDSPDAETTLTYDNKGKVIARTISYTYNALEQRPRLVYEGGSGQLNIISNNLLQYTETVYLYNPTTGIWSVYTGLIKDVGVYKLVVSISNQPNFYYAPSNMPIEVTVRINRKIVYYSLVDSFVYNGVLSHVPVVIRDAYAAELDRSQYQDIYAMVAAATYEYQIRQLSGWLTLAPGSKVINAGTYRVTVRINAGTNYNSANLLLQNGNPDPTTIVDALKEKQFTITKRQVDFRINTVTSYYLDELKAFNSEVTLTEPGPEDLPAQVVKSNLNDIMAILGALDIVIGTNGMSNGMAITKYSVKGEYPLTLVSRPSAETIANYEIVHFYDGIYEIITPSEAVLITTRNQLLDNIDALVDNSGESYKWYLSAGSYGAITIDKNVNLSIVGAYNESGVPAVVFDSIAILQGTVGLDIVKLEAKGNSALVELGSKAGALTVSRTVFTRAGSAFLTNSVAIHADMGYSNTIYMNTTTIYGFTAGILMMSGSINMQSCVLDNNVSALQVRNGDLEIHNSVFSYNKGEGIYIAGSNVACTLNGNSFIANVIGIKTTIAISNEVYNKNTFANNAKDIKRL